MRERERKEIEEKEKKQFSGQLQFLKLTFLK